MKKPILSLAAALSIVLLVAYTNRSTSLLSGFETGTPTIKSMNALAFGPEGILFIGDSKSASVFAIDTKDNEPLEKAKPLEIKNIDQKIADLLGTEAKNITIQDLVVNPVSKKVYCAVQAANGTTVLFKIEGDNLQAVSLKDIKFSVVPLNNAPAEDAKDQRGRPLRIWAISDLNYSDGKVMVSGLSNQEFGATFRSIPFPFINKQDHASLEIYHAAHGQYETDAPIKTFTTADINGKKFLVASYTCTPLVLFPLEDLKAGTHVKGRTVAEFGAGNTPVDMITMKKGDDLFLIMANTNRPVMKVKYKDIAAYQGTLSQPIKENYSTAGVPYISFPMVNVSQLDKLDDDQFVYIQRRDNGDLDIKTSSNRVL